MIKTEWHEDNGRWFVRASKQVGPRVFAATQTLTKAEQESGGLQVYALREHTCVKELEDGLKAAGCGLVIR